MLPTLFGGDYFVYGGCYDLYQVAQLAGYPPSRIDEIIPPKKATFLRLGPDGKRQRVAPVMAGVGSLSELADVFVPIQAEIVQFAGDDIIYYLGGALLTVGQVNDILGGTTLPAEVVELGANGVLVTRNSHQLVILTGEGWRHVPVTPEGRIVEVRGAG